MEYTLHFRSSGIPVLIVDYLALKEGYGAFDYVFLIKKGVVSSFLTRKGLKQAYEFGKKLLNREYAQKIIRQLEEFERDLKELKNKKLDKGAFT